jgi:hypothetical protein
MFRPPNKVKRNLNKAILVSNNFRDGIFVNLTMVKKKVPVNLSSNELIFVTDQFCLYDF